MTSDTFVNKKGTLIRLQLRPETKIDSKSLGSVKEMSKNSNVKVTSMKLKDNVFQENGIDQKKVREILCATSYEESRNLSKRKGMYALIEC